MFLSDLVLPARADTPWNLPLEVLKRELEQGERCEICFCRTLPRKHKNHNFSSCRKTVTVLKNDFSKCLTSLILHSHRDIFPTQDSNDHRFKNRVSFSVCNVHYVEFKRKLGNMEFKSDNPYFNFIHPEISFDSLMETSSEGRVVNISAKVRSPVPRGGRLLVNPISRKILIPGY